ncbi:hypothetical protein, partial [Pseudomonas savastanoi]|uniref:hypothetical protein n=1 Tax=Pseudomonas savastanoi TaxID=29438 RepID=UPI001969B93A
DLPDRAGKTRACLTAGPNQPEHKKTDTPAYARQHRSRAKLRLLDVSIQPGDHHQPVKTANAGFLFLP